MLIALPRRPTVWRIAACALACALLAASGLARAAETCPDIPDDEAARRSLAKDWFAKAEEAEAAGDRQAAARRYACSLKLVPHPSTAYNLGTAAEKAGDVSTAADAFKMYLSLAPEAADRAAVQARIARLDARVAELREQLARTPAAAAPEAPPPAPPPNPDLTARPAAPLAPPAAPPPPRQRYAVAGWVSLGVGAGALGAAVAFNLIARAKMSDCFDLAMDQPAEARAQCDAAKPFAYGSYGLFAAAGALGLTGVTLLLWPGEGTDGDTAISLSPTSTGGLLSASGRF